MSRYKFETTPSMAATAAISIFYSDAEELAGEARWWADSMPVTLQNSEKYETLYGIANTLEGFSQPDEPDIEEKIECVVGISMRTGKKRGIGESRATRLSNACSHGSAGVEALREWAEEQREKLEEASEASAETEKLLDEIDQFCSEVEDHVSEAEGLDFPSMMG